MLSNCNNIHLSFYYLTSKIYILTVDTWKRKQMDILPPHPLSGNNESVTNVNIHAPVTTAFPLLATLYNCYNDQHSESVHRTYFSVYVTLAHMECVIQFQLPTLIRHFNYAVAYFHWTVFLCGW